VPGAAAAVAAGWAIESSMTAGALLISRPVPLPCPAPADVAEGPDTSVRIGGSYLRRRSCRLDQFCLPAPPFTPYAGVPLRMALPAVHLHNKRPPPRAETTWILPLIDAVTKGW